MGTTTTIYKFYKPISGEMGVANQLNNNIDIMENQLVALEKGKANERHLHGDLATKEEMENHTHTEFFTINEKITKIENRISAIESFLQPDITTASISLVITEETTGFRFKCNIIPLSLGLTWELVLTTVPTGGLSMLIYSTTSFSDVIFVQNSHMFNQYPTGGEIQVRIRAKNMTGEYSAYATENFYFWPKYTEPGLAVRNSDLALILLTATNPTLAEQLLNIVEDTPENIKELIRSGHTVKLTPNFP